MRKLCFALLAAAIALVSGCALTVRSDANPALIGNVKCGSYAWAGAFRGNSPLRSTVANPLNEERLRAAITSHLAPGGTIQPVGSKADCLVGYGIGNNYVVDGTGAWPYYGGWYGYGWGGYGWGGYGWGPGWGYYGWGGPYVYSQGIIAIDVYDAKSGQPMWHASADQSLIDASGPEAQKRIDDAVTAIFTKRPPGV